MNQNETGRDEDGFSNRDRPEAVKVPKKNYQCNVCMKFFSSNQCLKDHQSVHTNSKPYTCDICGKIFRFGSQLCVHKRTHQIHADINCPKLTTLITVQKIQDDNQLTLLYEKVRLPPISSKQLFQLPSYLDIFKYLN